MRPEFGVAPPAVSFLCTAYQAESTIVATIESVRAQSRSDWELVVVDNGCSDALAAMVERYRDDGRIVLLRQPNRGISGGVNHAAAHARGRYLCVLNADDLVLPSFVAELVADLDGRPATAALACDAYFLAPYGIRRATYHGCPPQQQADGGVCTLASLVAGYIPYYSALVRRAAWQQVGGFREGIHGVQDLGFFVDLVTAGHRVEVVPRPLAVYRESEDSTSRGAAAVERVEQARLRVLGEAVSRFGGIEEQAALARTRAWSRHRRAMVAARRCLLAQDLPGARAAADAAWAQRPDLLTWLVVTGLRCGPGLVALGYRGRRRLVAAGRRLTVRRSDPLPLGRLTRVAAGSG